MENAYYVHSLSSKKPTPIPDVFSFKSIHQLLETPSFAQQEQEEVNDFFRLASLITDEVSLWFKSLIDRDKRGVVEINRQFIVCDFPKCPSGDFMSRMNRLSGAPS